MDARSAVASLGAREPWTVIVGRSSIELRLEGLAIRADGTFLVVDEKSGDIRVATGC